MPVFTPPWVDHWATSVSGASVGLPWAMTAIEEGPYLKCQTESCRHLAWTWKEHRDFAVAALSGDRPDAAAMMLAQCCEKAGPLAAAAAQAGNSGGMGTVWREPSIWAPASSRGSQGHN